MDYLSAGSLPWLAGLQQRMRMAAESQRLPHAALLLSAPGLGAEHLADWLAAFALCEGSGARPCGACASCSLLRVDNHPDFHLVKLDEDARQIKVDQVRDLIGTLQMKSYRGGYKVGVIAGAEALNAAGANAFLKTLEEPGGSTLLIIVARPTHRLPATVASRCMTLTVRAPGQAAALEWLAAYGPGGEPWATALELAGGAPLAALELRDANLGALDRDMHEGLKALGANAADVTLVAETWAKTNLPLRIMWLENWITRRVHSYLAGDISSQSAERVRLPAALLKPKIRSLFELLDAARELRRLAPTGINQQLALEALLLSGRTALAA